MPSKRLVRTAVICAVLAAGATACGDTKKNQSAAPAPAGSASAAPTPSATPTLDVSTLSGDEIAKQAKTAMKSATSFKVDGVVKSDGESISIHLSADRQGNCVGTVGLGGKGQIEILHNGTQTWVKPDAAFWKDMAAEKHADARTAAATAEIFKGRYLTGGQDDARLKGMTEMCGVVNGIANDDSSEGAVTKGATGTTNGVKTVSLTATDSDGSVSTLYVATEGKPYLIKMEQKTDGAMSFSDYDKPVTVQAPPADNVIDFSVFEQKLKSA